MEKVTLFWFRRDLRLFDNHGLSQALAAGFPVLPLFIYDINILDGLVDKSDARLQFIVNELESLHRTLTKFGSRLFTFVGTPPQVFHDLFQQYDVQLLIANRDYEPYAIQRDRLIYDLAKERGIPFKAYKDQVVLDRKEVLKEDGNPYVVFTPFSRKWKEVFRQELLQRHPIDLNPKNLVQASPQPISGLKEIGFKPVNIDYPDRTIDESIIRNYHQTRDLPGISGTTCLSLHLRFGTISIRELTRKAIQWNETYLNELIWREFYMMILYHFPRVVHQSFRQEYDRIPWRNDEKEFQAWCEGRTGYPIVDAGMRQLNESGYMHNRVRMITASFLTKHLLIDWRWGEAYFARKLLDYELASNNGGWQWAAGSGVDAAPYFRVFNPELQTKKFDPDHLYIKQWVAEWNSSAYPEPIVNHKEARERAIRVYRNALQ